MLTKADTLSYIGNFFAAMKECCFSISAKMHLILSPMMNASILKLLSLGLLLCSFVSNEVDWKETLIRKPILFMRALPANFD